MRIISGDHRGMKLIAPKGVKTRPTTDRIKESIFSIIESKKRISSKSVVLDLFAGSGAIGLEFLSRGASEVHFVDSDSSSINAVNENIKKCRKEDVSKVYKNEANKAVEILNKKGIKFDYIFMDPPYDKNIIPKVLETIYNNDILNLEGIIIVEHESDLDIEENVEGFKKIDSRKYGSSGVSFFIKEEKQV